MNRPVEGWCGPNGLISHGYVTDCFIESCIALWYLLSLVLFVVRWFELHTSAISSPPDRSPVHVAKKTFCGLMCGLSAVLALLSWFKPASPPYIQFSWTLHLVLWGFSLVLCTMEYQRFLPQSWLGLRGFWLVGGVEGIWRAGIFVLAFTVGLMPPGWAIPRASDPFPELPVRSSLFLWTACIILLTSICEIVLACLSFYQPADIPLALLPLITRLNRGEPTVLLPRVPDLLDRVTVDHPGAVRYGGADQTSLPPQAVDVFAKGDAEGVFGGGCGGGGGGGGGGSGGERLPLKLHVALSNVVLQTDPVQHRIHAEYKMLLRLEGEQRPRVSFKRYADFAALNSVFQSQFNRDRYPELYARLPHLPPKEPFRQETLSPAFLDQRRRGLEAYIRVIVQQEAFWLPELLNFLGLSVIEQRPFTEAHKEAIKRFEPDNPLRLRKPSDETYSEAASIDVAQDDIPSPLEREREGSPPRHTAAAAAPSAAAAAAAEEQMLMQPDQQIVLTSSAQLSSSAYSHAHEGEKGGVGVGVGGGVGVGYSVEGPGGPIPVRVSIDRYKLVQEGTPGVVPYVIYEVVTSTMHRTSTVVKRYREFDILFKKLHRILEVSPPKLPGKFYTMKRDHWFYEKRKADLTDWLNQVVQDAACASCPDLWEFLQIPMNEVPRPTASSPSGDTHAWARKASSGSESISLPSMAMESEGAAEMSRRVQQPGTADVLERTTTARPSFLTAEPKSAPSPPLLSRPPGSSTEPVQEWHVRCRMWQTVTVHQEKDTAYALQLYRCKPTGVKTWAIERPYRRFEELHWELAKKFSSPATGMSLLPPFPQRGFTLLATRAAQDREKEERGRRLEAYLTAILQSYETFKCPALDLFLAEPMQHATVAEGNEQQEAGVSSFAMTEEQQQQQQTGEGEGEGEGEGRG
ncbi:unnamed protein product [Vitrella brassicaformis CCMP3155]|uniref:PX domain-containing protein n=2 Tax=Vitrella brassicaformis TaxID=1169539 RepID=A0A0G4FIJ3_VITBC|nr:unnamed protein product [Vitrella brassicaformis CCMP3155]|eukprot:CEM13287.1 unnamed protein product [Vitrella brassicaformis CCMP3155]